ncbi:FKBP-type peptidyl-prolyl cis-trans isomerase [Alkalimonas collagenimarina]|uniref:Peptidyl-prolyl cis-trans isomerase n=1 Tax=Alkalimonas collagenimarina TaxID=400390 RepID=A0ABT9H4R3_9GAMM|nr:FKBP-type peptidyl-prolyl cis-trans isomerase [Alkalimonas collagenimarina]MDP4537880.1 FKBP-type peptidyl-prolyl cis-trans isomerase [Alkalimonas collagenimarina]
MKSFFQLLILFTIFLFPSLLSATTLSVAERLELNQQHVADMLAHPEVLVTASGLGYQEITAGTGARPSELSSVQVYYHGRLLTGQTFDKQLAPDEPLEFILHQVISGWQEGLQLMREGGTARLHIPPELAYGAHGVPGVPGVPPFSFLVFDIELIRVSGFRRD